MSKPFLAHLTGLPDVEQQNEFHFVEAVSGLHLQCAVLARPAARWVVAIDLPPQARIRREDPFHGGTLSLAASLCQRFGIAPEELRLFQHYVYTGSYESLYLAHGAGAIRDLFDGVRFSGFSRELLSPEQVPEIIRLLRGDEPLPLAWRFLTGRLQR